MHGIAHNIAGTFDFGAVGRFIAFVQYSLRCNATLHYRIVLYKRDSGRFQTDTLPDGVMQFHFVPQMDLAGGRSSDGTECAGSQRDQHQYHGDPAAPENRPPPDGLRDAGSWISCRLLHDCTIVSVGGLRSQCPCCMPSA